LNVFRSVGRRGATAVSYKEDSEDDKTGSDEFTEVNYDETSATPVEPDNADTIERVMLSRRGRKGGMSTNLVFTWVL